MITYRVTYHPLGGMYGPMAIHTRHRSYAAARRSAARLAHARGTWQGICVEDSQGPITIMRQVQDDARQTDAWPGDPDVSGNLADGYMVGVP